VDEDFDEKIISYRHLTPAAVEPRDSVVGLDGAAALGAFGVAVALDPMVGHDLRGFLRLDVSADAGGRRPLDAPLVHRVLANCRRVRDKKAVDISRNIYTSRKIITCAFFSELGSSGAGREGGDFSLGF
jgi:hypothetical protein